MPVPASSESASERRAGDLVGDMRDRVARFVDFGVRRPSQNSTWSGGCQKPNSGWDHEELAT